TLTFAAAGDALEAVTSAAFDVLHAEADHLVTVAPDADQTAGVPFNLTSIRAVDRYGNVADGANGAVAYAGEKTLTYTLSGDQNGPVTGTDSFTTAVTFANGVSTTPLTTTLYRAQKTTITASDASLPRNVDDVPTGEITVAAA